MDDTPNETPLPDGGPKPLIHDIPKPGRFRRLRANFLTGLVVSAPIGITIWLAVQVVEFIDDSVAGFIPARYTDVYTQYGLPGSGVVIVLVLLTIIGFLTRNYLGRSLLAYSERLVDRMPVIRSIYGALKQIFDAVIQQSSSSFREVVLVEYPRRGIWAVGFVTSSTRGEIQNLTEDDVVNVFLPTTPNPTSGFLLFVPRRDLVVLHMSVEEGIKMVISGGLVTPKDPRKTSAQKSPVINSRLDQPEFLEPQGQTVVQPERK
ncbi:MAG: DUF502 domain-containing protein [Alphaproteobacteria bacterium]|jgi:uncharacterized membrane protein